jgi:hypothetical protein
MKLLILKIISIGWLIFIVPLFGIFPLLVLIHAPMPRYILFMGLALLSSIIDLFVQDPALYFHASDEGPPLTKLGYITMIAIVFGIAFLSIHFLYKSKR